MTNITDDRGYNQTFAPSVAMTVRSERRCDYMLSQMSNVSADTHILEIGSGTGEIAALLASKTNAQITGTDICVPFIEEAQNTHQYPNLKFIALDFMRPQALAGLQFDYIVGNGILHHLYNQLDEALLNMKKLLKPQGKIIFLEPNLYNPYCFLIFNTTQRMRQWAKLESNEMALRKGKIERQLQKANYSNINIEYKDFLLPNTPSWLIKPIIFTGRILEKIPVLKMLAQSVFIVSEQKYENAEI